MEHENTVNIPEISLFGGPLQRLAKRLGLIREGGNSIPLGLVFGVSVWLILLVLAMLQGSLTRFFSAGVMAGHVRLLVAIPMFFVCESIITPRISDLIRYLVHAEIVPGPEQAGLKWVARRIERLRNFAWVEGVLFLLVFALPFVRFSGFLLGNSANAGWLMEQSGGKLTMVNAVYIGFALPLFRFLFLRWLWQLGLWWYFLYRLEKLNLKLIPTHSDGCGGLGYLEEVHVYFFPLVLAFSAIISASVAEKILTGIMPFEILYYVIPAAVVLNLFFFAFPLLIFSNKLRLSRISGWHHYMIMSAQYAQAFEQRWVRDRPQTGESQLGSADIQSLADLTNSINVIRDMRSVLISRKLVISYLIAVLIPFLPLVFVKFSFSDILLKIFQFLAG